MLPTHERAHTHARTRPRKVTYSSKQAEHCRQSILGRDCPCRLCPVRNLVRCASFLTVLGIHCISRSFPLPPQRAQWARGHGPGPGGPGHGHRHGDGHGHGSGVTVHVYPGTPYPRRALALDVLPLQQTGRRLFCGPWLPGAQRDRSGVP